MALASPISLWVTLWVCLLVGLLWHPTAAVGTSSTIKREQRILSATSVSEGDGRDDVPKWKKNVKKHVKRFRAKLAREEEATKQVEADRAHRREELDPTHKCCHCLKATRSGHQLTDHTGALVGVPRIMERDEPCSEHTLRSKSCSKACAKGDARWNSAGLPSSVDSTCPSAFEDDSSLGWTSRKCSYIRVESIRVY